MSTMVMRSGGSSLTFTINDGNGEVTAVNAVVANGPITVQLLNNEGGVKASVQITTSGNIPIPQNSRVVAVDGQFQRADGSFKTVKTFPHRIFW